MRPRIQKRIPLLYGRTACVRFTVCVRSIYPHNRIKIMNRLQQILSITLPIVILIKQLRHQHLAIMPLKHTHTIRRLTPRKLHHHLQRTIRPPPHQTINPHQRPAGFPLHEGVPRSGGGVRWSLTPHQDHQQNNPYIKPPFHARKDTTF